MATSCRQIGGLVLRIQGEFLNSPGLALTLPEAQQRFRVYGPACEAVLDTLADAKVLAKTPSGAYVRQLTPGTPAHAHMTSGQPLRAEHRKDAALHHRARHAA